MKNIKTAIIAGAIALAAIVAAVIIIVTSGSKGGLYVVSVTGGVNVSNTSEGTSLDAEADMELTSGDVLSIGEESTCTLAYKTAKNDGSNYMVVLSNSQLFITDDFNGKEDAEIYLNRGTVISSNAGDSDFNANIRTSNCGVETARSVNIITYAIGEDSSYTDVASMGGNVYIQLYDDQGNSVNEREPLGPKMKGRIVSGSDGPYFRYLNTEAKLSDFPAQTLRELFGISSLVQLEYTSSEIKEAYDAIPKEEKAENEPDVLEELPVPSGDGTIQTAETIATEPTEETTTTLMITESETETESETTTTVTTTVTSETTSDSSEDTEPDDTEPDETEEPDESGDKLHVYVIIDGEIYEQEVAYGESAVQPADPVISGKKFIGWDNSFENITADTTISALFEESDDTDTSGSGGTHTVTVVIGDKVTTQEVNDGEAANIPSSITLEGYTFKGWDTDYSHVTSDITVSAILEPMSCNVTFIVDGTRYYTSVSYGGTASAPVTPSANSLGQSFIGWDKDLSGITSDTTITALYDTSVKSYTVTFIVEGVSYTQTVESGNAAIPPYAPETNAEGLMFRGWDRDYSSINSDTTITAVYS